MIKVHQQESEIVSQVDRRHLLIEFQRIERHRPTLPETQIAQVQIAMRAANQAQSGAPLKPTFPAIDRL